MSEGKFVDVFGNPEGEDGRINKSSESKSRPGFGPEIPGLKQVEPGLYTAKNPPKSIFDNPKIAEGFKRACEKTKHESELYNARLKFFWLGFVCGSLATGGFALFFALFWR
jgi:hypothetical protein